MMPDGNSGLLRRLEELERSIQQLRGSVSSSNAPVVLKAVTAQSAADVAQANAEVAQSTADTANQAAEQASTDAATANTNASNAKTAAQQAAQQAQAAQSAAASKTKTTWSASAPTSSTPGSVDGDTWYVTNGTGGAAVAQYRWSAATTTWVQTAIDGSVLQNVVADTVKAGAIDGQVITGATVRSAASGQRAEVVSNRINFYNSAGAQGGYVTGATQPYGGTNYPAVGMTGSSSTSGVSCTAPIPWATAGTGAGPDFAASNFIPDDTVLGRALLTGKGNTGSAGLFRTSTTDGTTQVVVGYDTAVKQWVLNVTTATATDFVSGGVSLVDRQKTRTVGYTTTTGSAAADNQELTSNGFTVVAAKTQTNDFATIGANGINLVAGTYVASWSVNFNANMTTAGTTFVQMIVNDSTGNDYFRVPVSSGTDRAGITRAPFVIASGGGSLQIGYKKFAGFSSTTTGQLTIQKVG
jgi:hypothetical protein